MSPGRGRGSVPCWGLDLGGSKLAAVVIDAPVPLGQRPVCREVREWPTAGRDLRGLLMAVGGELRERHGPPATAGLAVAAAVAGEGAIGASPNLAAPAGHTLADWLREAAGCCCPVVMNDGNAFLHAELSTATVPAPACAVGVVLGTGVGGAVAFSGHVRRGPAGVAGEWGHVPPPREREPAALARRCGCGREGCIDALLGGPGWLWTARRHGLVVDSAEAAVAALRLGDPLALAAAHEYRERLARALSLWTDLLDPDLLILGGGLAGVSALVEDLGGLVAGCRYGSCEVPEIRVASLGRPAAAIGAALWAAQASGLADT